MSRLYTVNNGSIYFDSKIIKKLGFILRKNDDSDFTYLTIGESKPLIDIQLPKDQFAQKMGFYDTIAICV